MQFTREPLTDALKSRTKQYIQNLVSVEQGRTRHRVAAKVRVDIKLDTLVASLVQLFTSSTSRVGIAATGNLNVNTLHVVLRPVLLASRVQRNQLMAQNIVAVRNSLGHGERVGVVVLNHVVTGPGTRRVAAIDQTLLVDLEELEAGLVDLGAVAVAGGQVVEDGAVVGLGPLGPLHFDLGAGLDAGG